MKFIVIDASNGAESVVDEKYVKESLRGNYKDVEQAFKDFLTLGRIRTPFQYFEVREQEPLLKNCTCYMFSEPHYPISSCDPQIPYVEKEKS